MKRVDPDDVATTSFRAKSRRGSTGVPHRFGRYTVCSEIASGPSAVVYLASAESSSGFHKLCAVKALHPHLAADEAFVQMLHDEARFAARLTHPNVCPVYDFGHDNGTYYLVMDYVFGETLTTIAGKLAKQRTKARAQTHALIVSRFLAEACEGLHAGHELRGLEGTTTELVHCSVAPRNLMVSYDGGVRVMDFGIARVTGDERFATAESFRENIGYMAPELLQRHPIDRRADIWSLGVCLYEMLTLRRLIPQGTRAQVTNLLLRHPIKPPSEVRPELPPELDAIVMRALSPYRGRRYGSARDFARDLDRYISAQGGLNLSELAEWMQEAFARRLASRRKTLERALRRVRPSHQPTPSILHFPRDEAWSEGDATQALKKVTNQRTRSWWIWGAGGLVLGGALSLLLRQEPRFDTPADEPAVRQPEEENGHRAPTDVAARTAGDRTRHQSSKARGDTLKTPLAAEQSVDVKRTVRRKRAKRGRVRKIRTTKATTESQTKSSQAGRVSVPVSVVTPPGWAEIFLGSTHIGRSPITFQLTNGRHVLTLLPYGKEPAIKKTVNISKVGRARIVVRLDRSER